jgi:glutathione synthase/RimK-type ligase-like ATP-grasp enzyme
VILLWGLPGDRPLAMVRDALRRRGCRLALFDQRATPRATLALRVDERVHGSLAWDGIAVPFADVAAAYLRPYDSRRLPAVAAAGPGSAVWRHAIAVEDALAAWAEVTTARVINRPAAMAANNSKPYQLAWIRSLGFQVPETLITTDPEAAFAFWQRHGAVVYKSLSSVRSIVTRLSSEHIARVEDVVWCPTQFQAYVTGTDVRVHVVGDEAFACRIVSECDDYRYAGLRGGSVRIEACALEEGLAHRCRMLAGAMGLLVAGIDLRETPEGEWFCFEVNPAPGFSYYQDATGQPIDAAIAALLARPGA